ncbi:MAG: TetR/AcrR family transcriptional regulator [Miltoncostaeaceae bacterium]
MASDRTPVAARPSGGRVAQRRRTRQALLDAANELLEEGTRPSLEDVAERADVSRATAYRYFPSVDDLLADAVLDRTVMPADVLFPDDGGTLGERLLTVEEAVNGSLAADEVTVHVVSRLLADAWLSADGEDRAERPGRRMPLIEQAIAPFRERLGADGADRLRHAVALAIGTEAVITLRDVCLLAHDEARSTARWTIAALARAALDEADAHAG